MSKSILWELVFSGNCYADKIKMSDNEAYKNNYKQFEQELEKLCEGMTKEKKI